MANDPTPKLQEIADIAALLEAEEVDRDEVRGHFERAGLLGLWHELE